MRSRTGCLTCRTRKLKCDEQKPECSQCRKGARECRPSEGIVFRHQQNASMNTSLEDPSSGRGSLKGFYSYKNTFDKDSVWLDIPKHGRQFIPAGEVAVRAHAPVQDHTSRGFIFVDNSDPYAEDLEAALGESEAALLAASASSHAHEWNVPRSSSVETKTNGLEALSTAAAHDRLSYPSLSLDQPPLSAPDSTATFTSIPTASVSSGPSPNPPRNALPSQPSPSISVTSSNNNNNINFLLNPSQSHSPPVDPTIQHATDRRGSSMMSMSTPSHRALTEPKPDMPVETDHEVMFLLRHFSQAPGLWMDLFDLGTYFASYVPVRAMSNPLLKYAACAYAAKQLGRVKGSKPLPQEAGMKKSTMEAWADGKALDWVWYAAKYYDKAIQLLMKELQPKKGPPPLSTPEAFGQWQAAELCEENDNPRKRRRRYSESRFSNGVHSDEILAATAILSVYEFTDATGPAWNRHLSGVKSLLDVAEVGMMPLEQRPSPGSAAYHQRKKSGLSKARKATFWNFARQDYLAAFINDCQTRLNTDDLVLWTEAGLQIDNMGFIRPSNNTAAGYPEGEDVMKEDLIGNGLIWILSKIVNFTTAGDNINLEAVGAGTLGISQQVLLERWYRLTTELDVWYNGLPDTFRPCARLPARQESDSDEGFALSEIWYSLPVCSSAMQHYHMARILLLINKPHASTSRRSTINNRLNSYRSIENEIRFHSREIVGISMARPEGSVRINSLQPLFVSGQCLIDGRERRVVLHLLRGIEDELGWATSYRVQQLLREWGWTEGSEMGVS
ncbi:hypothetical protein FE257_004586 [Aspergillus nanangensis]|uniref:Zn(2)-C6 fungal-type domain-containing protein n=1 Tax=Aspergillus nanangensis TaxID=2582783 RepID=A0AAD4D027_ASPNN|nr:hypothetical protein FE257_004586 [Aspergillus nanangensis]